MSKPETNPLEAMTVSVAPGIGPTVACLAQASPAGEIFVAVGGAAPCAARLLANLDRYELAKPHYRGRDVLVVFQDGDRGKPIIIGLLEEPLESMVEMTAATKETPDRKQELRIDGKRVVIEADDEIELKCGQGSITIRKDGKIVVKGTHVLSHATGPNRIRGGSVSLN